MPLGPNSPRDERPDLSSGLLSRSINDEGNGPEWLERVGDGGGWELESDTSEGVGEGGPYEILWGESRPSVGDCVEEDTCWLELGGSSIVMLIEGTLLASSPPAMVVREEVRKVFASCEAPSVSRYPFEWRTAFKTAALMLRSRFRMRQVAYGN